MKTQFQIMLTVIPETEISTAAFIRWLKEQFHGCDLGAVKLNNLRRQQYDIVQSVLLSANDYDISGEKTNEKQKTNDTEIN